METTILIERNEAMQLVAWKELMALSIQRRRDIVKEILFYDETPEEEVKQVDSLSEIFNHKIVDYLIKKLLCATNEYIEDELKTLYNKNYMVVGEPILYDKCECCGYRTIEAHIGWDICPNCYWEDDGIKELNKHSPVNRMTLQQGRDNFIEFEACSSEFVKYVKAGRKRYLR
ncbi:hypothetical protein DVR12_17850 [Chitinophaga silvatica]|uniref:Cysteine-rich CPCC domain-containing protein n=1 Tax=Chitinophaga silvatica TaxID=2282649 RepID=A0A3E1Y8J7_9BACT|nr:CPCC family cysteine-rich protein [Chitinophaga silvatica]RFS21198.1 hypothetical protein DVR12_17850 [Chitinophaga silvatica]